MNAASIVDFLRRPPSYPEKTERVELRETHISWVFLTDTRAYKLKKPVKFDFLDFTTLRRRRQACQDEVRLNGRLAPDVYLATVPVTVDAAGHLAIDGDGEEVDCLVKMRRLPDEQSLAAKIRSDSVSTSDVDLFAERLARFYRDQPPVAMPAQSYRHAIERHTRANRQALLDSAGAMGVGALAAGARDVIRRVHTAQLFYIECFPAELDARAGDGRIVDGHGDLRPEHIYFTPGPVIIDCIEFSSEFRQLDVADELCFLSMECSHAGAPWIGERILEAYADSSADRIAGRLRAFYTTYRACVRAKVHCLRADQKAPEQPSAVLPAMPRSKEAREAIDAASRYLSLADHIARELAGPLLLLVRGPAGVGKTTLARTLADRLGADHVQTDAVRRELFGPPSEPSGLEGGRYSAENRAEVYRATLARADRLLSHGRSVVADGTFLTETLLRQADAIATRYQAARLFVDCHCPAEVATARIRRRRQQEDSLSEAQTDIHQRQALQQQSTPDDLPQCHVDTTEAMPAMLQAVFAALRTQSPSQ